MRISKTTSLGSFAVVNGEKNNTVKAFKNEG